MLWLSSVFSNKKSVPPSQVAGFSLVELMISITIMVIVISIVSTSQGAFNAAVLLRGQAYEAALQIRQIQLTAVGAVGDAGVFRAVYGVHFNTSPATDGRYAIFRDANANGFYDPGEEYGQQGLVDRRFEIRDIRTIGGSSLPGQEISIVFVRPNFDARFIQAPNTELTGPGVEIDFARRGSSGTGSGDVRTVEVTTAGQISVKPL